MNQDTYKDIVGQQGRWTVSVTWSDGRVEELPTIHADFIDWKAREYRRRVDDPRGDQRLYVAKNRAWEEAIRRTKRVVVTRDRWEADGSVVREGYVGIWDIDSLMIDEEGNRFRLAGERYLPSQSYYRR